MKKSVNTFVLVTADCFAQSISILGADFITPEEVTKAYPSIVYNAEQTKALAKNLPSEDMLKWCKDNDYAVMPAPPTAMSILDMQDIRSAHFYSMDEWYNNEKFAREDKTSFGWLAIKKTPVANSTINPWSEQDKLLSALEKVPNVAEVCWFIAIYLEVRGVWIFKNIFLRTSSLDSNGNTVRIGRIYYFNCIDVTSFWDEYRYDIIGLSATLKQ